MQTPFSDIESLMIPDIYCPFPSQISPYLEQVREHTLEWVQRFRLIQREIARQYFLAIDISCFSCRVYPMASLEELFFINDWVGWITLFDDRFDDSGLSARPDYMYQVHQHLLALLQDPPLVTPQGPVAEALSDVWQRADCLTSSTWKRRFAQHHADYFAACRWDAENRALQRVPDVHAYIENRRNSVANTISFDMFDLSEHIEFPTEVYESQPFQAVLQAANNIVAWHNDVYSLRKELAHGDICNLVVAVRHAQRCSLQEAVNQVCTMIEMETRRFQVLVQDFPAYSAELDPEIRRYLFDLGKWIRGPLDWYQETLRYVEVEYTERGKASSYLEEILPFPES
jgi:Terpene synthase family 2, C-terminal metal binding